MDIIHEGKDFRDCGLTNGVVALMESSHHMSEICQDGPITAGWNIQHCIDWCVYTLSEGPVVLYNTGSSGVDVW